MRILSIADRQKIQTGIENFYPRRRPADSLLDINSSLTNQFNLLRVVDNHNHPAFFEYAGCQYEIHIKKQPTVEVLSNG